MNYTRAIAFFAFCLIVLVVPILFAQSSAPASSAGAAVVGGEGADSVDVRADELEYEASQKLMTARGRVVVTRDKDILKADYMTIRTDTQDAHAVGNVVFEREGNVWKGDEISYNFKDRTGNFGRFNASIAPFFIRAENSKRATPDEFVLHNATITTCEGDRPDVYLKAREARVIKQNKIVARGVVFYVGAVPIFYAPKWTHDIKGDNKTDIDFVPGYGSRVGAYLLTAYNYRMECGVKASTHLDYRTKRGVGVGQDFSWGDPDLPHRGEVKTYYANDSSPMERRSENERKNLEGLVDSDRYRVRLSDVHDLSDRDYAVTELNYLSDPAVLEDFFDDEFRHNVQPENRITLAHRADKFIAGLELNKRLNDFYDNVDRLPEATLDVPRLPLGESPFYYESHNAASFLKKEFADKSNQDSYDAFRLDSAHKVFYPSKHFGFLNVIPRTGYRGTYYSKTIENGTVTNLVTTMGTNGVVSASNQVVSAAADTGSDLRNLYELGFETSFKSFGVLDNGWLNRDDQGLRHVVEPYLDYTYIPEPNLTPDQLLQFDDVDTLDKRNDVLLGVRNKLQTKRKGRAHDLVDMNVWSTYYVEKPRGASNDFSDIFFKTELRLLDWLPIDFKGSYDQYEGQVDTFDTQVSVLWPDQTRLGLDYRYANNSYDQLASELTLFPNRIWSLNAYGRYSLETRQVEEQSYFVEHKGRCVGWGVGFKEIDDDFQVWLRFWLIAFPKSGVALGR
jgi:lipopolysaccharide assembly outer membrane protein LptD (OstA)